jgi:carbon-monoxide dehydrogenase small subunit
VRVLLVVNGTRHDLDLEAGRTLGEALREDCGLTGTHLGCVDGTCGACTVLIGGEPVRSCLLLAAQCEGAEVRTVEGLPADDPLRAALPAAGSAPGENGEGCAAGLVMLAAAAREQNPEDLRRLLAANRCRCAGHPVLTDAVIRAATVAP